MRKILSRQFLQAVLCVGVIIFFGLGGISGISKAYGGPFDELYKEAKKEGRVLVYTALVSRDFKPIIDAFNSTFPGVKAEFHRAPGTKLGITFEEEMKAGAPTADLMNHSVPTKMAEYTKKGWFLEHHIANVKDYLWVGEYPKGPLHIGYWYPWIGATMSPFYNTKLLGVKPPLNDWKDLADKRFAGKMVVVAMGIGGSPIMYWSMLREHYGISIWEEIAALKPTIYPSHGNVFRDVMAGENPVGLFLHQSTVMRNIQTKKAPLKIVWPKGPDGKLLIPQVPMGMGIVNHKKLHKNAAKLFMNWLQSRKGQEQVKNASWRWAMNPHVSPPPHFTTTLKEIHPYWPDFGVLKERSPEWINDWNRIFKQ